MKNKLAKRMASLVLAVVMVASALPFTPIVASADNKPTLLAQYFTTGDYTYDAVTGSKDALKVEEGTVTASTDGTATFDSAYMSITDTDIFKNVDANYGFTVSFNLKANNPWSSYEHAFSFGKNPDTNVDNPSTYDHLYMVATRGWVNWDCNFHVCYVDNSGSENLRAYPEDATPIQNTSPINVTVTFTREGITYYIDGVKYADHYYSGTGTDLEAILNNMSTYKYNYIGDSRYNGNPNYSGTMRDFRIYNGAMTESQVKNEFVNYTVGSDWTLVSSTDFENAHWQANNTDGYGFTSTDGSNNYMQWYGHEYTGSGHSYVDYNESGLGAKIRDGYIYMNGYTDDGSTFTTSGTPITGADNFLIDMQFRFYGDFTAPNYDRGFFAILADSSYSDLTGGPENKSNTFINQLGDGKINTTNTVGAKSASTAIGSDVLGKNTAYHYIIEYREGTIEVYVTDAYGLRVIDYGKFKDTLDTSKISGFRIGDDNNSWYYNYLEVDNINMYTKPATTGSEKDHYIFPYFTGNNDSRTGLSKYNSNIGFAETQAIRLAISEDCQTYTALNNNYPVITQMGETTSYNARDPYIIQGQDGYYYIIATDEDYSDWNWSKESHRFVLWRSTDFLSWEEYDVDLYDLPGCGKDDLNNTINYAWAPEIIWDSSANKYMIYFAFVDKLHSIAECGTSSQVLYYIYATDLFDVSTWEEPKKLFNATEVNDSGACIDADIIEIDGTYYMFYKSEGRGTISLVKSDSLTGPYTDLLMLNHGYSYGATEGCQVWIDAESNVRYLADCYGLNLGFAVYNFGKNIEALYRKAYYGTMSYKTDGDDYEVDGYMVDISGYYDSVSNDSFKQFSPRHGSVLKINESQYNALIRANNKGLFNNAAEDKSGMDLEISDNLILRYLVDDVKSNTGTKTAGQYELSGTAEWQSTGYMNKYGAAYFNASSLTANIGTAISSNASVDTGLTISFYGKPDYKTAITGRFVELANYGVAANNWDNLQSTSNYISFNNTTAGDSNRGYIEIASGSYSNREWNMGLMPYNLAGGWHLYTVTLNGTTVTSYVDGNKINSITSDKVNDTLYNGFTNINLGGAIFSNDAQYTGWLRDVRVYNVGLTDAQVKKLPAQYYTDVSSGDANYANLDSAMEAYEELIANLASSGYNAMLTNLSDGYTAYKAAVAAKASGTEADKATALANLNSAITNMKPFREVTGNHTPVYGTQVESDYYNNLVYTDSSSDSNFYEEGKAIIYGSTGSFWKYGTHAYIYYPNTVLLYDGKSTPTVPVVAGFLNADHRYSVNMLYLNESIDAFDLQHTWWYGLTDKTSLAWPDHQQGPCIPTDTSNTIEYTYAETINHDANNDTTTYRMYKNALELNDAPIGTYTCYSATGWQMCGQYTYTWVDYQIKTTLMNTGPDIVVLDYSKLTTALRNAANNGTNQEYLSALKSKYSEGGLENLFAAYDSATSLDPNEGSTYFEHNYDYAGEAENFGKEEPMDIAALLCAADIDNSVKLLGSIRPTTSEAKYQRLCNAIDEYEAKMNAMKNIYTNLSAAYKAYIIAVEYRDAYKYGNRTSESEYKSPTLDEAAVNLEKYTANMEPFTNLTWDGQAYYEGTVAVTGGQNILYCSQAGGWTGTITKNYLNVDYYLPNTVVTIYDSTENLPYYPTVISEKSQSSAGKHWGFMECELASNSKFALSDNWRGLLEGATGASTYKYVDANDDNYNVGGKVDNKDQKFYNVTPGHELSYRTDVVPYVENNTNYNVNLFTGYNYNTSTARYWYNRLVYTGSGDTTNYYEIAGNTTFTHYGYHDSWGNKHQNDSKTSSGKTAYVITYKPLRDKLVSVSNDWSTNGIKVSDYQEGGLADWFDKIDILTEIDPNQYDSTNHPNGYDYSTGESYSGKTGTEGAVYRCASDIKGALMQTASMSTTVPEGVEDEKTNGTIYDENGVLQQISVTNGAYTNLKIALEEVNTAPTDQGCITDATWSAFNDAIADAQAAMSDIANANTSHTYTGKEDYNSSKYDEEDINNLADALDTAISNLYELSNSAHPLIFLYEDTAEHMGYFHCYSNNGHILDGETHSTVSPAEMQSYDTLGIVYNTLDLSKYTNAGLIATGKTAYDNVKTVAGAAGVSPQDIVDTGTRALLNAINSANGDEEGTEGVVDSFTVTVNVYQLDSTGSETTSVGSAQTITRSYGTSLTVDIADEYWLPLIQAADSNIGSADDINVAYWTVDGREIVQKTSTTTLDVYTTKTLTVNAYIKSVIPEADGVISINNIASKQLHEIGVSSDDTKIQVKATDSNGNSINNIIVGDKTYRVPNSITYNITGWVINGVDYVTADDDGYVVNSTFGELKSGENSITIRPIKEMNSAQKKGSTDYDTYTFTLDGETFLEKVKYDYRLSFTSEKENCYAIVFYNSDGDVFVPVAYGNSYELYANRSMDFYSLIKKDGKYYFNLGDEEKEITDEELIFILDRKLPMMYSYSEFTGDITGTIEAKLDDQGNVIEPAIYYSNKWTTRSAFTTNVGGGDYGNVTITECGTLRTKSALNESTFTIENVGSLGINQKVNTNRYLGSNQYSYSFNSNNNTTVYTRAYVKYQYTYGTGDDKTTIDAIAYGPICTSLYGVPANS